MKSPLRTGFQGLRKTQVAVASCVAVLTAFVVLLSAATAGALPSDRAYEMVSPVDKRGQDAGSGGFAGRYVSSPSGDALLYPALGGWGDAPANALTGVYYAQRGEEGWSSTSVLLPSFPKTLGSTGVYAVSDDLTKVITMSDEDLETGGQATNYLGDLYLLDPVTKAMERLTADSVDGVATAPLSAGSYEGTSDYSTVIFQSNMALTDDELVGFTGNVPRLYRYSEGELTMVSRTPDGDAVNGSLPIFSASSTAHLPTNRVSETAEVVFFRSQYPSSPQALYRRDMSVTPAVTDLVNASENSLETVTVGAADMIGASSGGLIAYFSSAQRLVDEDTDSTADFYRYDHTQPEGSRLTLISVDSEPGDASSATTSSYGVTDDGESVFFTSNSQLVEGETTAAGPKLFLWHEGELHFVALTGTAVTTRNSTWSDNQKYFAFLANGSDITPEDNGGTLQAYRYEMETGEIKCVSCLAEGANTTAASWRRDQSAQLVKAFTEPIRNVANDGSVFFQTAESLVGEDTNGKIDVYIWSEENGAELISSGRSTDDSWMMDASVDGSTAFILTRSRLSAWDNDDLLDAYAVRVGGGLPEPPEAETPCLGEDCLAPPSKQPTFTDPSTADNQSAGNPKADDTRDCSVLDSKAKRLQRKAQRKANQVRSANGKKAKKKAKRKAKQAKKQAKQSAKRAERCNQEAGR